VAGAAQAASGAAEEAEAASSGAQAGVAKWVAAAVPRTRSSGWGRAGHRRAVLISAVVLIVILGGGVAAWAEVSSSSAGYRMTSVTRANIATSLTVVGTVDPVSDAAASFQVGGQVTSLTVTPGQQVTAGQTLGTLDTTALSDTVSSDQSTLNADEAKLVEDEENESNAAASKAGSNGSNNAKSATSSTTTTTTSPSHSGSGGQGGQDATVTADQTTLTQDESTLSSDQQKEAADLTQAQTDCTTANTGTPTGQATCEAALETVQSDEQQVSKDQETVSKDETALGQALDAESSGGSSSTSGGTTGGTTGNSGAPTQGGHALDASSTDFTGNTGTGSGNTGTGTGSLGGSANTSGGDSSDTDTPEQIASDQANIDTAQAQLINAEQSLNEATLTSPISGTVVSVGINVGDTVSADSSTEIVTIIGTKAYEVEGTLDSSQVPTVKVGQSASVEVDGADGAMEGTVSQVGPVQSSDSGYSYPVVVALPATTETLFTGSTSNVTITTGSVSNVVVVPTSAVQTLETRSYVLVVDKGQLTRKVVKIGMVGDEYTQVISGLSPGQSVVLADYSEAVPSTSTNTDEFGGGFGGLGGGGDFAGGGFAGGGAFQFRAPGGAAGAVTIGG
jgi:multidrug efflux pump subunit AcrA (membrane-fusion protein)